MAVVRVASRGVESGNREGGRTVTSGKEARRRRAHRRARNQPTLSCPARGRGLSSPTVPRGQKLERTKIAFVRRSSIKATWPRGARLGVTVWAAAST